MRMRADAMETEPAHRISVVYRSAIIRDFQRHEKLTCQQSRDESGSQFLNNSFGSINTFQCDELDN